MVCMSELYGLRVANGGHLFPDIRVHQKSSVRAKPALINLKPQDKHQTDLAIYSLSSEKEEPAIIATTNPQFGP